MNLLDRYLTNGVKGSLAGVFAAALLFGLSQRAGAELSFWQHMLSVFADHYFLIYFMLPIFLLMCFFIMEDDAESVVMRYGTYDRYFVRKWGAASAITALFLSAQFAAVAVSASGLPPGKDWSLPAGTLLQEIFALFGRYFSAPPVAVAVVLSFMLAGLCVLAALLLWLGHFLSRPASAKILFLLYFLTVGSIKISVLGDLPITAFNHLFILHHNLADTGRLLLTVATAAALLFLIHLTVKRYWQWAPFTARRSPKGIMQYCVKALFTRRNLSVMAAVAVVMTLWRFLRYGDNPAGDDWIIGLFAGHGAGYFRPMEFIETIMLNGAPLYLLAVFMERMNAECSIFVVVRLERRRKLTAAILLSSSAFILVYCAFLALSPVLGAGFAGIPFGAGAWSLLGMAVALKLLDILAQFLFFVCLFALTGRAAIGFICLIAVNMLCAIPVAPMRYLPFGLSGLSRISLPQTDGGAPFPLAASVLLIMNAGCIVWLFTRGYRRLPKN